MKIALIGWYGHGNAGDERIGFCIEQFLSGRGHSCNRHEVFTFLDLPESSINAYDYVLMGGGGIINHNLNKKTKQLDNVRCRFSCIGIGIDGIYSDNKKFVDALLAKSEFFMVRDRESYKMTGPHYKAIRSHDLSFLDPFPIEDVERLSAKSCGLNLRDWPFWNLAFNSLFDRRFRDMNFQRFIDRYPFRKHDPREIVRVVKKHFHDIRGIPFYAPGDSREVPDVELLSSLDIACTGGKFNAENMRRLASHIGMRFHHLVFCAQMGIPCISLVYQRKNASLLAEIGCPELSVNIFNMQTELPMAIQHLENNHGEIRRKFLQYRNKAHGELLSTMQKVAHLIESPAQATAKPA